MKKKCIKATAILCSIIAALFATTPSVSANSAQSYWSGADASGAIVQGGECPIVVSHETLTFNIEDFPNTYYTDYTELISDYKSTVTAEYTFVNPASYDVSATLVFPCGTIPDYAQYYYHENYNGIAEQLNYYGATVSGEPVTTVQRYTYSPYQGFDLKEDMPRLRDGFIEDDYFSAETPVTAVTYEILEMPSGYNTVYLNIRIDADKKIVYKYDSYPSSRLFVTDDGNKSDTLFALSKKSVVTVYYLGEDTYSDAEVTLYGTSHHTKELDSDILVTNTDGSITNLLDLVLAQRDERSTVSDIDWYNAAVESLGDEPSTSIEALDVSRELLCWYQYDITVPAGGTITNSVTAPIYPSIDGGYDPPIYLYTYLTSPAASWASFGTLDVIINTPYYLTDSVCEFEKTDSGYKTQFDSLPDGELTFTLCESENPQKHQSPLLIIIGIIAVGLVIGVILAIIFWPITLVLIAISAVIGVICFIFNLITMLIL